MQLFFHYLGMPYLLEGILVTLEVTALGLFGGTVLGLLLTAMQLSRFWVLSAIARTYTVIFRGTPLILQMVFFYDALPHIGIKLPAMLAAGLALACNEAPFIAEMLRAGVLGTDRRGAGCVERAQRDPAGGRLLGRIDVEFLVVQRHDAGRRIASVQFQIAFDAPLAVDHPADQHGDVPFHAHMRPARLGEMGRHLS